MKNIEIQKNIFLAPIWETHRRGKNWCAILKEDSSKQEGFSRVKFLDRAYTKEGNGYRADELKAGMIIEIGADYYTTSGHQQKRRIYWKIEDITQEYMLVEEAENYFDLLQEEAKQKEKNIYLCNTFTLNMLNLNESILFKTKKITLEEAKELLKEGFTSAVGHQSTAELLTSILGIDIPMNRIQIALEKGDKLVVFQIAVRLEEGKILTTEELQELLKEGKIYFALVEVL